jgi:LacI family transcriptional regulator
VLDPFARHTITAEHWGTRYDGIIARATPQLASQATKAGVPVVNVWLGSPERNLPRVVPDLAAAGRMVAEHLISRGLKQFGYVGFKRRVSSAQEFAGFRGAVERIGANCTSHFFSHTSSRTAQKWSQMIADLSKWIETWKLPIGVFGTQDTVCRFLIDVCLRRGLRIPEDVAMVGVANELAICDEPEPSLSSVDVGPARIGYRAAELLDHLMRGKAPPREPIMVEPSEVVVRRSTDVFAVDDQMVARAMQFMVRHGSELFRVDDVVAALPITRRSLERRFRATLGRSIDEEIWRLRLDRAKRLIVGTNSTIGSIAVASGFSNDKHFHKVFRRSVGMTPLAFRRQQST